ncbi:MAG: DUF805 domain-containing protein [Pseudomonadota bacterium]
MNFSQAVKSGFKNYATFSGRAARSEYWYWFLFYTIGTWSVLLLQLLIAGPSNTGSTGQAFVIVQLMFILATFIPGIAVTFRRLHDLDRSAWWLLIMLIPLLGPLVLLYWMCVRGTAGSNRFGDDPLA